MDAVEKQDKERARARAALDAAESERAARRRAEDAWLEREAEARRATMEAQNAAVAAVRRREARDAAHAAATGGAPPRPRVWTGEIDPRYPRPLWGYSGSGSSRPPAMPCGHMYSDCARPNVAMEYGDDLMFNICADCADRFKPAPERGDPRWGDYSRGVSDLLRAEWNMRVLMKGAGPFSGSHARA